MLDYLLVVRGYSRLITAVVVLTGGAAAVYVWTQPARYRAEARLQLSPANAAAELSRAHQVLSSADNIAAAKRAVPAKAGDPETEVSIATSSEPAGLTVTATASDPNAAAALANAVAERGARLFAEVFAADAEQDLAETRDGLNRARARVSELRARLIDAKRRVEAAGEAHQQLRSYRALLEEGQREAEYRRTRIGRLEQELRAVGGRSAEGVAAPRITGGTLAGALTYELAVARADLAGVERRLEVIRALLDSKAAAAASAQFPRLELDLAQIQTEYDMANNTLLEQLQLMERLPSRRLRLELAARATPPEARSRATSWLTVPFAMCAALVAAMVAAFLLNYLAAASRSPRF